MSTDSFHFPDALSTDELREQLEERARRIIERREEEYDDAAERYAIDEHRITAPEGPYGIFVMGDPHLDSPGSDIRTLQAHLRCIQDTPGVLPLCVGDVMDNWIGRLADNYADGRTSVDDTGVLVEWFLSRLPHPVLVQGNHDRWPTPLRGLLDRLSMEYTSIHAPHELRLVLRQDSGHELRIRARHKFKGHSMWHPMHGILRAAKMGPWRADVLLQGHVHTWGSHTEQYPGGHGPWTGIVVAGYKVHGDYAVKGQFDPDGTSDGASCLVVVDPYFSPGSAPQVFWDIDAGCRYLMTTRAAWAAQEDYEKAKAKGEIE